MIKKIIFTLFIFSSIYPIFSQDYKEDSLAVRAILDANGLDSIRVKNVAVEENGRIVRLLLENKSLYTIPSDIGKLTGLLSLRLRSNILTSLPNEIQNCSLLVNLNCSRNQISNLSMIVNLNKMVCLQIYENDLDIIPSEIVNLSLLKYLLCQNNKIKTFPEGLSNLKNLQEINFAGNLIEALPDDIIEIDLPQGDIGINLCYNENLVFTEEQKEWARVENYFEYEGMYCKTQIDGLKLIKSDKYLRINYCQNLINYTLPYDTHICIEVLDLKGMLLETLVNTYKKTGDYSIHWVGYKNKSGMYLIRIKDDNSIFVKKTMVIK